jgi:hypothetical protein
MLMGEKLPGRGGTISISFDLTDEYEEGTLLANNTEAD